MPAAVKTSISPGIKVSFANTPQAKNDSFSLCESASGLATLDVLANDGGGSAATLWSLDDGNSDNGVGELLTQHSSGLSQNGIAITIDNGVVRYDVGALMQKTGGFDHLAQGVTEVVDTFTYAIRLSNGTISWATATVTIVGENDAPEAKAAAATVLEDASIAGKVEATDADDGATLTYALTGAAPEGLTFHTDGTYSFDASSYDHLAAGKSEVLNVGYSVTDEHGATGTNTLAITVTGQNDTAEMTPSGAFNLKEDSGTYTQAGTINLSDLDDGEATFGQVEFTSAFGSWNFDPATGGWSYTMANGSTAVQALSTGDHKADTLTVHSSDGTAHTTITANIAGTDEPVTIQGTYVAEVEGIPGTPGTPATDPVYTTLTYTTGTPASDAKYGTWNSWVSALNTWRAQQTEAHGNDLVTTSTTLNFTSPDKTLTYDNTFKYLSTPGSPATPGTDPVPGTPEYIKIDNNYFVSFNADTKLIFDIEGGSGTLEQLIQLTKVGLIDVDNDGMLDDTVILFGKGDTLTLVNAGASSLTELAGHIAFSDLTTIA